MIEFRCENCGKAFRVDDTLAGKRGKCSCGRELIVPMLHVPTAPDDVPHRDQSAANPWQASEFELPEGTKAVPSRRAATAKLGKTPASWLAILDWRFEYYLTPWIIRVLWVLVLLFALATVVLNTLGLAWGLLPDFSSGPSTSHYGRGFDVPSEPILPSWFTVRFAKVFLYVVSVVGSVVVVLVTRVILELMIVVFRIAEDIGTLKRKYAEAEMKVG